MVENLLNKMKFIELADLYNLPAAASVKVSDESNLRLVEERLEKPFLIKPSYRHYWFHKNFQEIVGPYKKAYVCRSFQELQKRYRKIAQINQNVVVQEYIEGPDDHMYDVNMYIDESGSIVGRKMRVYPPTAGYGSYVITVNDEEILELSKQIAERLQLFGMVNVQFKKDENTGKPMLIEIHTRTSIFDVLGIKSGINIPAIYYADMTGARLPENRNGRYGVKYFNVSRDLRFIVKNRKNVTLSELIQSYKGTKIFDGFSIKDPIPAVMDLWWTIRHSVSLLIR